VLLDGRQEEAVLGQSLHGSHHNVRESQAVAHLLRLAPRQIGCEQGVVVVQLLAVELAGALLRTVDLQGIGINIYVKFLPVSFPEPTL